LFRRCFVQGLVAAAAAIKAAGYRRNSKLTKVFSLLEQKLPELKRSFSYRGGAELVLQVLHWGIAAGDYQAKPDFALRLLERSPLNSVQKLQ